MVNAIIFSKDRACQLDLLLRSIEKNCPNLFNEIKVLYTWSSEEYAQGYDKLFKQDKLNVEFYVEHNTPAPTEFRNQTLELVADSDFVSLFTDDTVFHRPFEFKGELIDRFLSEIKSVFSLRLGYNTVVQNIHAKPFPTMQPYLHFCIEQDGVLSWNPKYYRCTNNYGYPFSIDGHIYHSEFLLSLMEKINFKNTNQLEGGLTAYANLINKMYAFNKSCCVNIPCNNLSSITVAGEYHPFTTKELNDCFLAGKHILLDSIEQADIAGCHQEIPLEVE